DPAKGTIQVRGVFGNAGKDLLPGMSVRVRLEFGPPRRVLELPASAFIRTADGVWFVYVITDNKLERRTVKFGWNDGDRVFLEEGLDKDDWVVIEAAGKNLQPGDRVEPRRASSKD